MKKNMQKKELICLIDLLNCLKEKRYWGPPQNKDRCFYLQQRYI